MRLRRRLTTANITWCVVGKSQALPCGEDEKHPCRSGCFAQYSIGFGAFRLDDVTDFLDSQLLHQHIRFCRVMLGEAGSQHRSDDVDEEKLGRDRQSHTEIATHHPGETRLQRHEHDLKEKTDESVHEPHSLEHGQHGRAKSWLPLGLFSILLFLLIPRSHPGLSWLVAHSSVLRYVQEVFHPKPLCCCPGSSGLDASSPAPNASCI